MRENESVTPQPADKPARLNILGHPNLLSWTNQAAENVTQQARSESDLFNTNNTSWLLKTTGNHLMNFARDNALKTHGEKIPNYKIIEAITKEVHNRANIARLAMITMPFAALITIETFLNGSWTGFIPDGPWFPLVLVAHYGLPPAILFAVTKIPAEFVAKIIESRRLGITKKDTDTIVAGGEAIRNFLGN